MFQLFFYSFSPIHEQIQMNCFIIVLKEQWECAIVNDSVWNEKFCFVSAQRLAINSSQRIKLLLRDKQQNWLNLTWKNGLIWWKKKLKISMSIQCTIAKFSDMNKSENQVIRNGGKWNEYSFLPRWLRRQLCNFIEISATIKACS